MPGHGRPAWVGKRRHQRLVQLRRALGSSAAKPRPSSRDPGFDAQAILDAAGRKLDRIRESEAAERQRKAREEAAEALRKEREERQSKVEEDVRRQRRDYWNDRNVEFIRRWYDGDDGALLEYASGIRDPLEHIRRFQTRLQSMAPSGVEPDDVFGTFMAELRRCFDRKTIFEKVGLDMRLMFNYVAAVYDKQLGKHYWKTKRQTYLDTGRCVRLDEPIGDDSDTTKMHYLFDRDNWYAKFMSYSSKEELVQYVREVVAKMKPYDRKLALMVMRGLTQQQCSEAFGVTRQAISARLKRMSLEFRHDRLCRCGYRIPDITFRIVQLAAKIAAHRFETGCAKLDAMRARLKGLQEKEANDIVERSRRARSLTDGRSGLRSSRVVRSMLEDAARREVDAFRSDKAQIEEVTEMLSDAEARWASAEDPEQNGQDKALEPIDADAADSPEAVEQPAQDEEEPETVEGPVMEDRTAEDAYEYWHGDGDVSVENRDVNYLAIAGC